MRAIAPLLKSILEAMNFFKILTRISYSLSVAVTGIVSGTVTIIVLCLVTFEVISCRNGSTFPTYLLPSRRCYSSYWEVLQGFATSRAGLIILAILIIPRLITFCVRTWNLLNEKNMRSAKGRRLRVIVLNKIAQDVAVYWLKVSFKISLWILIVNGVFLLFPLALCVGNDLSKCTIYLQSLPFGSTKEILINILVSLLIICLGIKVSKHFGISLLED
ncbi:hypothetical protein [Coleofasciculus sp. FACHB-T130]|uniref:hypothetical protein n=1 Tax=Cyanophyceae TaxID=3028117 RepID=UPI0016835561|nr:hypothetical protein [Coleofasciculus sp. FACHB-T130]MBD1879475.1 hypothetical protein [Coleofasciculus sp. FACHB-T130]